MGKAKPAARAARCRLLLLPIYRRRGTRPARRAAQKPANQGKRKPDADASRTADATRQAPATEGRGPPQATTARAAARMSGQRRGAAPQPQGQTETGKARDRETTANPQNEGLRQQTPRTGEAVGSATALSLAK